jgi:hypothetical protein
MGYDRVLGQIRWDKKLGQKVGTKSWDKKL